MTESKKINDILNKVSREQKNEEALIQANKIEKVLGSLTNITVERRDEIESLIERMRSTDGTNIRTLKMQISKSDQLIESLENLNRLTSESNKELSAKAKEEEAGRIDKIEENTSHIGDISRLTAESKAANDDKALSETENKREADAKAKEEAKKLDKIEENTSHIKDIKLEAPKTFGALTGAITGLLTSVATGVIAGISSQIRGGKLFAPIKNAFNAILKPFGSTGKIFAGLTKIKFIGPIIDDIIKFGSMFFKFGATLGKLAGPLGIVISVISGLVGGIKGAIRGFKEDGVFGALKEGFVGIIQGMIGSLVQGLADAAGWILRKLGFENLGAVLGPAVEDILSGIYNGIRAVFDLVKGVFTLDSDLIVTSMKTVISSIWSILKSIFEIGVSFLTDIFQGFVDFVSMVKDLLPTLWTAFKENIVLIPSIIAENILSVMEFIPELFGKIKDTLIPWISERVLSTFSKIGETVMDFITPILDFDFMGAIRKIPGVGKVIDFISGDDDEVKEPKKPKKGRVSKSRINKSVDVETSGARIEAFKTDSLNKKSEIMNPNVSVVNQTSSTVGDTNVSHVTIAPGNHVDRTFGMFAPGF